MELGSQRGAQRRPVWAPVGLGHSRNSADDEKRGSQRQGDSYSQRFPLHNGPRASPATAFLRRCRSSRKSSRGTNGTPSLGEVHIRDLLTLSRPESQVQTLALRTTDESQGAGDNSSEVWLGWGGAVGARWRG